MAILQKRHRFTCRHPVPLLTRQTWSSVQVRYQIIPSFINVGIEYAKVSDRHSSTDTANVARFYSQNAEMPKQQMMLKYYYKRQDR